MRRVINQYLLLGWLVTGLLTGCSKNSSSSASVYEVQVGGWTYRCSPQLVTQKGVDQLLVRITLSSPNPSQDPLRYEVSGLDAYNARVQYFLSGAQQDFDLVAATGAVLPAASYFFENSYNLTPASQFVVGFELPSNTRTKPVTLEYQDQVFNTGLIKFQFIPSDYLRASPKS
ncbi:MAG: hypothetical protein EOP52_05660 [Sphingobacteriales bacterium]|nr:MAG: hypothetical protein EOP52_05660 [Sphingobacteriales bacterium]